MSTAVAIFVAFAAFLAAVAVIAKSPVGKGLRWVWNRLVGQPGADWFRHNVNVVIEPQIALLREENTQQHSEGAKRQKATEERLMYAITDLDQRNTADHIEMKAGIAEARASIASTRESLEEERGVAGGERADISDLIKSNDPL